MDIRQVEAIDVHAHYGQCRVKNELKDRFASGDIERVMQYAQLARTRHTIVSPLTAIMPRGNNDPVLGNTVSEGIARDMAGFLFWAVVDPAKQETFRQAQRLLELPQCMGIKIHPEEHQYPIREYGDRIFAFAASQRCVVETHSGEQNSMPEDFVPFADKYPEVRLIISHLGCGYDGYQTHQVKAIQMCKNGNMFTDTSSAQGITPNLLEWAVGEIGADRILYGTDNPLYFTPMQRARVDYAEISNEDKLKILRENALLLFKDKWKQLNLYNPG